MIAIFQIEAELDALLPTILPPSPSFGETGNRAFKGEL